MFRTGLPVLAWLLATACGDGTGAITGPDDGEPCVTGSPTCRTRIDVAGGVRVPAYTTTPLDRGSPDVTLAVIMIHGTNRDADAYFETAVAAAREAEALPGTVIVAPLFQTAEDGPRSDEARWTSGGWKRGHLSASSGPSPRVSSYAVLDRILELVTDAARFPAVTRVVVAGHSAGGQVVHRYAATSRWEDEEGAVPVRYAPANPSTWLYVGPERRVGAGGFAVPDRESCPEYNDWHYGLDERNTWASAVGIDSIRAQLRRRDVRVLAGTADSGSASLDVSCGANLQGSYRYERALWLMEFMDALVPGHRHRLVEVEGVGHSSRSMFTSEAGVEAVFQH